MNKTHIQIAHDHTTGGRTVLVKSRGWRGSFPADLLTERKDVLDTLIADAEALADSESVRAYAQIAEQTEQIAEAEQTVQAKTAEVAHKQRMLTTVLPAVEASAPDEVLLEVADIFDEYEVGMHMYVGKVFSYDGVLYKSRQEHTAQEDWIPGTEGTLSIYHRIQLPPEEGEILPWVPGEELKKGYIRHYEPNGLDYEVLQDHTSQADWLPPDLPSLYKAL